MPSTSLVSLRRRLAIIFEDEEPRSALTRAFNLALTLLIVVNVSCVILESVESIRQHFGPAFDQFEKIATAIFAAEYVCRVWACVDFHSANYRDSGLGSATLRAKFFCACRSSRGIAGDPRIFRRRRLPDFAAASPVADAQAGAALDDFRLLFSVLREERQSIAALLFVLLLTVIDLRIADVHA